MCLKFFLEKLFITCSIHFLSLILWISYTAWNSFQNRYPIQKVKSENCTSPWVRKPNYFKFAVIRVLIYSNFEVGRDINNFRQTLYVWHWSFFPIIPMLKYNLQDSHLMIKICRHVQKSPNYRPALLSLDNPFEVVHHHQSRLRFFFRPQYLMLQSIAPLHSYLPCILFRCFFLVTP